MDQDVSFFVGVIPCVVLEHLHETDLVAVGQVVEIFKETLLFWIILEVVAVLLNALTSHVLSISVSLQLSGCLESFLV